MKDERLLYSKYATHSSIIKLEKAVKWQKRPHFSAAHKRAYIA